MHLTKNKLLILTWFWSLLCVVLTVYITFGTSVQQGFLETIPSFVALGLWVAIPMLLIVDPFVPKVFWVLAVGGGPCMILSLIGTFWLIGTKDWKLILLYLFFVLSLGPYIAIVFFMRKFLKSCKKRAQLDAENIRLEEERRRNETQLERERFRNQLEMDAQNEQVLQLLDRQEFEKQQLKEKLKKGKSRR
ncbi:hypothetical protein L3Y34_003574 [Caenorhabditis briggsae]|uniref:Uncharacterized protein n=1 Tax=Caenorhabditis briggsae TaxID=6238 RepID=A0AAE9D3G9_CAEBR|nr:hypothetical protein L3Y34_003574 [Caenorhabditis briggsae]